MRGYLLTSFLGARSVLACGHAPYQNHAQKRHAGYYGAYERHQKFDAFGFIWHIVSNILLEPLFKELEDDTVTVRDRDTAEQERVSVGELESYFSARLQ